MKTNELMFGDWVQPCSRSYPVQVESLSADTINGDMDAAFEPIPLTPEILEKNGFKACGYEELVLETDEYCFALQKGVDGINAWWWEMFSSPIIPINCVHELQHCLKLVGIDKEIVL